MACSAVLLAKRALVALLHALAPLYNVQSTCTRNSSDDDIVKVFRKLVLKTHPDRGGNVRHQQQLNEARASWEIAKKKARGASASSRSAEPPLSMVPASAQRNEYRVRGTSVLLTYNGFSDPAQWLALNAFVLSHLQPWKARHWCTTLETCASGKFHAHVMLQFKSEVDRTVSSFVFERLKPNVSPTDLCGDGLCRKRLQMSIDRGFFYVWANKIGTARLSCGGLCVAGNYAPVWTDELFRYQVLGAWPEKLWKQRKVTTEVYKEYLYLTRDGVPARKRNLDAVVHEEERQELQALIANNTKRIRSNPELYKPFPEIAEVTAWLKLFEMDALRYPVLLLLGASMSGKTEYANSLFRSPLELKVGPLLHFPDALREFNRKIHDGIILDDVRDLSFLTENQDKIQGKYNVQLEFGVTPGGQCKYEKYLFRIPIVATLNYSTQNLSLLDTHDWLSKPGNRVVVHFRGVVA